MALTLKEAVTLLQSGAWLTGLRFFTANVDKGTGGKVLELAKCRIARNQDKKSNDTISESQVAATGIKRDPNHNFHFTRNIQLPNHSIIKVHPILITHINHQPVI
jgi:hypothetical protein